MQKIKPSDTLNSAILLLEIKREEELVILKEQFQITYESLKPINLLKNTFSELTHSPDFKNGVGSSVIGIATGFLTRKILLRQSRNPIKRLLGVVLQTLVTNFAAKNSDKIKSTGEFLLNAITTKRKLNGRNLSEAETDNNKEVF